MGAPEKTKKSREGTIQSKESIQKITFDVRESNLLEIVGGDGLLGLLDSSTLGFLAYKIQIVWSVKWEMMEKALWRTVDEVEALGLEEFINFRSSESTVIHTKTRRSVFSSLDGWREKVMLTPKFPWLTRD